MAERVRITGKNDGANNNEAIDAQVDSTFDALHVKSHLFGYDGVGFTRELIVNTDGSVNVNSVTVPTDYDYVSYGYTGTNITTIVYKTGGSGGTTVMTKTLAYDGSNNLTSVTIT